jgi:D-alanyl-lipoteichoic acid acyltransferase DltB (MBOAT superfamily)
MLEHLLIALSIASILVGMVRVLGIDLGPSFDQPLRSASVLEWWRRWNTHFRDLLVELFYYPVVMRLRRRR